MRYADVLRRMRSQKSTAGESKAGNRKIITENVEATENRVEGMGKWNSRKRL